MREFNRLAIALLVIGAAGCGGGGGGGGGSAGVTPSATQDAFVAATTQVIASATGEANESQDIAAFQPTADDTKEPEPLALN